MLLKRTSWLWIGGLLLLSAILLTVFLANRPSTQEGIPEVVDFNQHIRPILSDKCFKCHGPDANKREADLRLDTKEGAFAALADQPDAFAVVPGDLQASELYHRIVASDPNVIMPPPEAHLELSPREVKLLEAWIEQGAEYKNHWAFLPPEKAALPEVGKRDWANNDIDLFILDAMQDRGLSPNEEADKARLLKRVALDLTGLPPSMELQEQFMTDDGPDAYEKVVDQLLQSEHYGEKMALHWLDVARYADSHGYQDDGRRTMWPWRDWVIHAFNENYPYDQFVRWQLAGDLIPNANKEMILATGFNRNHKITQEGGVIDEEYRIEYVTDRTNTFGKAFLAMTFECAKCHDHKYDPISQEEYFQTFAFFNQVPEKGLYGTIDLASLADPPSIEISPEEVAETMQFIKLRDTMPVAVMVMEDADTLRTTHILDRGVYDSPTKVVSPGTPSRLFPFDTIQFASNRLGLADWVLHEDNPLTARVYVNRLWQELFGKGLVKTVGDFGMQGDLPTHIDLLDWLAVDFQEHEWDIKRMVKQIVMSATYRQSAEVSDRQLARDPENLYYARSPRNRIAAELVRDLVLASSDLLNDEIGGPSVKTYQPDGIWESATSGRGELARYVQDHGNDLYRRGMYTFIKRTVPPPVMLMFDASNRDQCEVRRPNTNTPLQALVMMNDPHVLEAARVMAEKLSQADLTSEAQIDQAFRRILCREPDSKERKSLLEYLQEEQAYFAEHEAEAADFLSVGEYPRAEGIASETDLAALMQIIHTLYNLEETLIKT
ncbi:MAG: PSD1 and planctomycete cytochrome C domain-containing protein [Bacteroidota bacterium]